jgi:hypothetical protein
MFLLLNLILNDLKKHESDIQMNNNWNTPLLNNEMWFFLVKVIFYNYKNFGYIIYVALCNQFSAIATNTS